MNTSLAAVFHGAGRPLEMRRIPYAQPRGAEVLVRVLGCTLCGSDLHTYDGRRQVPVPTILGHEIVGEIAALGDQAATADLAGQTLSVGDRVTWSLVASCGQCFYCLRDLPQKCLRCVKYGHESLRPGRELTGGLAEHCWLSPGTAIMRLPSELELEVACPASCATATISAAMAAAGEVRDRHVCLFGAGMLGLTAIAMLRVAGAASVVAVDVQPGRLGRAMQFGATHAVTPSAADETAAALTESHGFDVIIELSGNSAAVECGWPLLRNGGTLVMVGSVFPTPAVSVLPEQIVRRNLTIRGVHNYAPRDLKTAVRFLTDHHQLFPFTELVSDWFPLSSADDAFAAARDPDRLRVGVRA